MTTPPATGSSPAGPPPTGPPDADVALSAGAAGVGRRSFLTGGLAALGGAALALGGARVIDAASPEPTEPAPAQADAAGRATVPFRGARQAGVATPAQTFMTFVALDLAPDVDRDGLVRLMRIWTDDVGRLMAGRPTLSDAEPELAPVPASLTVTVGYGPAVFAAAGLDHLRPIWLAPLPVYSIDRVEETWSGGDLLLQVGADHAITVAHAVRVLVRGARTFASVRWQQRGFRNSPGTVPPGTTVRNLMGQLDGSRNLVPGTDDDALIWPAASAPAWFVGCTSMVIRRIAMNLDTWDALDRSGREAAMGRRLDTGAPLTGTVESDIPDLEAVDDLGLPVIQEVAHIRRARSDNPAERLLRRGHNYDDAPTPGALSSSGLIFVAFQADVDRQYIPIQRRLDELDLVNRWTTPIGSAVFAVPPGCGPDEHLGQGLLEA